jgi:hypothetical protein
MFEYKVLGTLWLENETIIVALVDGENPIKTLSEVLQLHTALNHYAQQGWEIASSYGGGDVTKGVVILRREKKERFN